MQVNMMLENSEGWDGIRYHHTLALELQDMARPSHFLATPKILKCKEVAFVLGHPSLLLDVNSAT
jgi:hypothetical protein